MTGLGNLRKPVQLALKTPEVRHLYFAQVRHYYFAATVKILLIYVMST
jgi:hypothetical protein